MNCDGGTKQQQVCGSEALIDYVVFLKIKLPSPVVAQRPKTYPYVVIEPMRNFSAQWLSFRMQFGDLVSGMRHGLGRQCRNSSHTSTMARFKVTSLRAINDIPLADPSKWLHGVEDSIRFLVDHAQQEEVLIYASGAHVLVHGVLAPAANLNPPDSNDLQHSMFPGQEDGWVIQRVYGGGKGHRMYLELPLRSKSFVGGEKLIFRRTFEGVQKGRASIELSQKLVHSLGIYFVPERNAYCRLDEQGDIEDVIRVTYFK
jgi:hypothetical protein